MRSQLGNECRKLFRKMMTVDFPAYKADKSQAEPHGWYIWTFRHPCRLYFHIILVIRGSFDEFTLEAGWSIDGKLKTFQGEADRGILLSGPSRFRIDSLIPLGDRTALVSNPVHFIVGRFLSDGEIWWAFVLRPEEFDQRFDYDEEPVEKCLPLVAPAVQEARDLLRKYLVPFFEEVLDKQKG